MDRVEVHDALNEAVANALVHSNYYGRRGIVIIKHGKEITISNPGTIRITKEEFYAGGNSDPRNPNASDTATVHLSRHILPCNPRNNPGKHL